MSVRGASAAALRNGVKISKTGVDAVDSHMASPCHPILSTTEVLDCIPAYICIIVIKWKSLNYRGSHY